MSFEHLCDGYSLAGFAYRVIDGRHMVGMNGNLDTIHDGLIEVRQHTSGGEEAVEMAKFITDTLNAAFSEEKIAIFVVGDE